MGGWAGLSKLLLSYPSEHIIILHLTVSVPLPQFGSIGTLGVRIKVRDEDRGSDIIRHCHDHSRANYLGIFHHPTFGISP